LFLSIIPRLAWNTKSGIEPDLSLQLEFVNIDGDDNGKSVHISHVCWQWLLTSSNLQSWLLLVFPCTQLQSLFLIIFSVSPLLFLYKNVGIKPDLSAQLGLVNVDGNVVDSKVGIIVGSDEGLCDGLVDGMYEDNSVGSSEEYKVGTIDGCKVGIDEWWSLGTDDGIFVNNK